MTTWLMADLSIGGCLGEEGSLGTVSGQNNVRATHGALPTAPMRSTQHFRCLKRLHQPVHDTRTADLSARIPTVDVLNQRRLFDSGSSGSDLGVLQQDPGAMGADVAWGENSEPSSRRWWIDRNHWQLPDSAGHPDERATVIPREQATAPT